MDGMPHGKGELMQITEYYKKAFGSTGTEGFELWANRSKYVGEFMFGDKHGDGKLIWQDQSTYNGKWENGKMCG